jgi:hypothetical protein
VLGATNYTAVGVAVDIAFSTYTTPVTKFQLTGRSPDTSTPTTISSPASQIGDPVAGSERSTSRCSSTSPGRHRTRQRLLGAPPTSAPSAYRIWLVVDAAAAGSSG